MKPRTALWVAIWACLCVQARSQTPELTLRQLTHRVFSPAEGAPADIYALAQTTDGTLWIAGRTGLSRFDGIRFVSYPGPAEAQLPSTNLSSLIASPDGGLWIGYRLGGASFLKDGALISYGEAEGFPLGTVEQFAWDRDGSLWAASRLGLARFRTGHWQQVTDEHQLGAPLGVLVDRAGTLWVATSEGLFARVSGESRFREIERDAGFSSSAVNLAASPDGRIWAIPAGRELLRVDRWADPSPGGAVTIHGIGRGPLLFDRHGYLWAADALGDTMLRASLDELTREGLPAISVNLDRLSIHDGLLIGQRLSAALEDREGNVWVATASGGLERFSHSNVVGDAAPTCRSYGFTAAAFAPGDDGSIWMACDDSTRYHVKQIRGGAVLRRFRTQPFDIAYRDFQGTIWFGGSTALGHLENGRMISTPLPTHLRGRPVQALLHDHSGAMWVSISRRSLFRLLNGVWSEYGNLQGLPRGYPLNEMEDASGALWFGYPYNRIARVSGAHVQMFGSEQGLEIGNVLAMLDQDGQIWAAGELGLAHFNGTRFVSVHSASGSPFRGLSGIVRARDGDFWLNGVSGIVHIPRQEMEHALHDSDYRVRHETFDSVDGVPGAAYQVRPQPSVIQTTDGHIWFSTTGGIVSIDPSRLARNTLAPPVTIWSLTSGRAVYPNPRAALNLPVHSNNLQIDYTAGSLSVPERVRFRYQLEGSDPEWQDVGGRREALYTNLGPGHYRFRVIASNNDGLWNNTGASIEFTIAPAFYQTRWFYALCALACVAAMTMLYRVRLRQVAAQVRARLEARLAERERIARELHDTLLQGMQGLIWRFQAATDRIPRSEPARALMEQSLDRADRLLEEGRDRVKDLRPAAHHTGDLAQALAAEGEQFVQLHAANFRVSVQGERRDLHPIVREEGFMIAREALGNAFRHAGAADIEAEVTYADSALHVRVRDNGAGISTAVLEAGGRPGHFGLIGMRERAKKLGAHVEVWSNPGAGTEVDLRVPAQVAYVHRRRRFRRARS